MNTTVKKPNLKQAQKRYVKTIIGWGCSFFILFIIAVKLVIADKLNIYVVVPMLALPLLGVIFALRRFLKDGDEMQKRVLVEALLWGLSVLMMIIIPWGYMEVMTPKLPRFPLFFLGNVFMLVFLGKLMHGHWKTGMFSKTQDYDPWREPKK